MFLWFIGVFFCEEELVGEPTRVVASGGVLAAAGSTKNRLSGYEKDIGVGQRAFCLWFVAKRPSTTGQ